MSGPNDQRGDGSPRDGSLSETVYAHLRAIAQAHVARERSDHTLSATALVHEVYLKLVPAGVAPGDRAGFYHAAAQAMRRILVDHARRRGAAKRGGGGRRAALDIHGVADLARDDQLDRALELEAAYVRLEQEDPEAAEVVRLRFYAGLTGDQAAEVMGISPRQADRAWAFARAFLMQELSRADESPSDP
jgi:RNA polymerase sigma factor (TIGR02999 family)